MQQKLRFGTMLAFAAIPIRRAAKKTTVELLTEMEGN